MKRFYKYLKQIFWDNPASSLKKSLVLFGLCLFISLIFRSYSLYGEIIQIDEADFAAQGNMITQGGMAYVDFVEKKPILSYYFFALPFYFFGWKIFYVHLLLIFWVSLTGFFLYKILHLYGLSQEGFLAAIGYSLFSVCLPTSSSLGATPVNMMNLPVAISAYFFLVSIKKERFPLFFVSGFFASLASLFKHQGGVVLLAFCFFLLFLLIKKRKTFLFTLNAGFLVSFGFFIPWFLSMIVYYKMGYINEFLEWNFYNNFKYIQSGLSFSDKLYRFVTDGGVYFLCSFPLLFLSYKCFSKNFFDDLNIFIIFLFSATVISVSAGGRFLTQYFVQFTPILVLSSAIGFVKILNHFPGEYRARKIAFRFFIFSPIFWFFFHWIGHFPRPSVPVLKEFGSYINQISDKDDKVFVWGYLPYIYYMSQREPGSRFIIGEYLVPYWEKKFRKDDSFDFSELDNWHKKNLELLLVDLKKSEPRLFIDLSTFDFRREWSIYQLPKFADLWLYVTEHYDIYSSFYGATIYKRKDMIQKIQQD